MRTIRDISILTAAVLICGCSKSDENVKLPETQLTITAEFAENDDTKTTLQDTGVYWEVGDEIKVFYRSGSGRFTSTNTEVTKTASFSGSISTVIGSEEGFVGGEYMWGLYPYCSDATYDGTSVSTTIPEQQTGKAGSFAKNMNISLAKSSNLALAFYNVCGGLRFSVTRNDITDVVFEGRNNEDLAGTIQVGFSEGVPVIQSLTSGQKKITLKAPNSETFESGKWYYIVAAPGTLTNGFKLTFNTATQFAELVKTSSVTVKRGIFGSVEDADEGLVFVDYAQMSVTLNHAGELSSVLGDAKNSIVNLKISGDINGDDFRCIRTMSSLQKIDISDARIVSGGESFIKYGETAEGYNNIGMWASEDHYTKTDSLEFNFWGMKNLDEIKLPKSLKYIGRYSFYGCHKIRELKIPSVTNMGYGHLEADAFWSCISLQAIIVEEGNKSLYSLDGCLFSTYSEDKAWLVAVPAGKTKYTIPDFVDALSSYTFPQGCQLQELTLLSHSPELEPYFFDNFTKLQKFVVDRSNNQYCDINGVLYSKDLLTVVCYPSGRTDETYNILPGTTIVGDGCFNTSGNLRSIIIPEGVTHIGYASFFDCRQLESVSLPSSLLSIEGASFQHNYQLKTLTSYAIQPPVFEEKVYYIFAGSSLKDIFVPNSAVKTYKESDGWSEYADIIKPIEP